MSLMGEKQSHENKKKKRVSFSLQQKMLKSLTPKRLEAATVSLVQIQKTDIKPSMKNENRSIKKSVTKHV